MHNFSNIILNRHLIYHLPPSMFYLCSFYLCSYEKHNSSWKSIHQKMLSIQMHWECNKSTNYEDDHSIVLCVLGVEWCQSISHTFFNVCKATSTAHDVASYFDADVKRLLYQREQVVIIHIHRGKDRWPRARRDKTLLGHCCNVEYCSNLFIHCTNPIILFHCASFHVDPVTQK